MSSPRVHGAFLGLISTRVTPGLRGRGHEHRPHSVGEERHYHTREVAEPRGELRPVGLWSWGSSLKSQGLPQLEESPSARQAWEDWALRMGIWASRLLGDWGTSRVCEKWQDLDPAHGESQCHGPSKGSSAGWGCARADPALPPVSLPGFAWCPGHLYIEVLS